MKFARRRATDDVTPETDPAAPPAPVAPRGRPTAAYAGIVDGQSLWVAVDAQPGTLALRPADGGDVVALTDSSSDDQPAFTAACLDLTGLPAGAEPATYDVVLVVGSKPPRVLWTAPLAPVTPRTARDGVTQHRLVRGPEGALQVVRRTLPDAASLRGATTEVGALHLTLVGAGPRLAALGNDGQVVASWDVVDQRATLTIDSLADVEPQGTRLVTGEPGAWRPIRRRGNDLPDPGKTVNLPPVFAADRDEPLFRLRWSPQAVLLLRVVGAEA